MAQSIFPKLITSVFEPSFWKLTSATLTQETADLRYLKFPTAQGSEIFPSNISVSGTTSLGATTATGLITANGGLTTGSGQVLTSTGTTTLTGATTASDLITANGGLNTTYITPIYTTPTFTSGMIGFNNSVTINSNPYTAGTNLDTGNLTLPAGSYIFNIYTNIFNIAPAFTFMMIYATTGTTLLRQQDFANQTGNACNFGFSLPYISTVSASYFGRVNVSSPASSSYIIQPLILIATRIA